MLVGFFFMAAAALMAEGGAGRLYFRKQEGSGAWGAPVLWSVRFAPNHGLSPQSGPVQRGGKGFLRLTGLSPRGFLGLTALSGLKVVVAAGAASIYAACRQRWWTPLKMKGAMMIKSRSRPAGEARLYGFSFRGAELQNSSPEGRYHNPRRRRRRQT